jgi:hypothetical protein
VRRGAHAARRIAAIAGATMAALVANATALCAQRGGFQLEARADGIFAATNAIHAGIGASMRMGNYVRLGGLGALGASFERGGSQTSGRADATARFLLDPLRQTRWGPYGGAGLSARHESATGWRGYLLVFLGVDGPTIGGRLDPALEVGLAGGARVGIVLRSAQSGHR